VLHYVAPEARSAQIGTQDRETRKEKAAFNRAKKAEKKYSRQLRGVATQVGKIVTGLSPGGVPHAAAITQALRRYAEILQPWALSVGTAMVTDVSRRDEAVWASLSSEMTRPLREEIARAPTGKMFRERQAEQVALITSLPLRAAERVHKIAQKMMLSGARMEELRDEIMRTGHVTRSRANLIARTEVARVASGMVQARAEYVGSVGYIWRTAQDDDVRKSHRKMRGRFVRWDSPPTTDGMVGHAGQLPNCRCYPEPVIPDEIE
jgi:SPP1 gp7 family putative phage head morphogenesis protein